MQLLPKLYKAINDRIESDQEKDFRTHLGASVIGKKCARELWYAWRWAIKEWFPGQKLRLFETGHLYEPRFIKMLKGAGLEVWPFDPATGEQWRVSGHNGHFGGSADGVGRGVPDIDTREAVTISCKTHNAASFAKLVDVGLMGSKFEHFIQEQVYMHKLTPKYPIRKCLYIAVNKDTDEIHPELIEYDQTEAERAEKRAGDIIYANVPPPRIANTPGHYNCKFCLFKRLCHFGDSFDYKLQANCRTCLHSRPAEAGIWRCALQPDLRLDKKAQEKGCGSYTQHPKLSGVQP